MDNAVQKENCPSLEELSEFADNQVDNRILAHLEHCEKCRKTVDSFIQLDNLVSEISRPSPDLAARIIQQCRQDSLSLEDSLPCLPQPVPAARHPWRTVLKVAAGFAVVLGVSWLWLGGPAEKRAKSAATAASVPQADPRAVAAASQDQADQNISLDTAATGIVPSRSLQENTKVVNPHPQDALAAVALVASAAPASPEDSYSMSELRNLQGQIQRRSLKSVSTNAQKYRVLNLETTQRPIDQVTEHIWSVPDLEAAVEIIDRVALSCHSEIIWQSTSDNLVKTGRFLASDSELQEIVDSLYDSKWVLLSPQLPQPHNGQAVAFNGNDILYTVKLLSNSSNAQ